MRWGTRQLPFGNLNDAHPFCKTNEVLTWEATNTLTGGLPPGAPAEVSDVDPRGSLARGENGLDPLLSGSTSTVVHPLTTSAPICWPTGNLSPSCPYRL